MPEITESDVALMHEAIGHPNCDPLGTEVLGCEQSVRVAQLFADQREALAVTQLVDTTELMRRVLATHVQEHPSILGMNPPIRDEGFMVYARQAGRGFYVACSCGDITDPGPRPNQDPGVTTDGSRLRALVLGRQHLATEIARALEAG